VGDPEDPVLRTTHDHGRIPWAAQSAELGHSLLLLLFLGLFFVASPCLWAQDAKDSLDAVASSQVDETVRAIM
jgi:hypothetical protein